MELNRPSYLDSPKSFWLGLLGILCIVSITLGLFSHWIFSTLPGESIHLAECILISFVYTLMFLSAFGGTWFFFHNWFPLYKNRNFIFHGIGQIFNAAIGFITGSVLNELLLRYLFRDTDFIQFNIETELALSALLCIVGILFINGFYYSRAFLKRSLEAEKRNTESELKALRSQINPHFLFNSLNSIAALIRNAPAEAETVTEDLADLFRYTLRAGDRPLVSLKEEVEIIEIYLNIEKARFQDRLTVEIEVPEELKSAQLPVLTLQPLVENAIKHGVSKKEGRHHIRLIIHRHGKLIEIGCYDTGPGFSEKDFNKVLNKGTGLSNVFQRLKLHFGNEVDGAISKYGIMLQVPFEPKPGESP